VGLLNEEGMRFNIFIVTFIVILLFSACQYEQKTTAPDELVGVWKTMEPKYAGSFLEFTENTIIIGTVEGEKISRVIKTVGKKAIGSEEIILYTIHYGNSEEENITLSILYNPANNGTIRFQNQDRIVWIKEKF
jgi:hypothetical protein